jgi:hypothetical protein
MATLNVRNELEALVAKMAANGRTVNGTSLDGIIKRISAVEGDELKGRIIVPAWFSTFEHGRGKATKGSKEVNAQGLTVFGAAIYIWMQKKGLFRSRTEKGKINEARGLAWYINKHGNKHFRERVYIDIYTTFVKEITKSITEKVKFEAIKITSELVKI